MIGGSPCVLQNRLAPIPEESTLEFVAGKRRSLADTPYVANHLGEDDAGQLICTYNIEMVEDYYDGDEAISGTISLHRKKQSNTLYTINALNETIRSLNNGVLDKSFPIPWENYQNNLLLTNEEGLNIIPTKIFKIINVKDW